MARTTQTRHSTRPIPPQPQRQTERISQDKTQEIQDRRKEARADSGVALSAVHLELFALSGFVELFDERMMDLDADRLKQATLALGLDVQSIARALISLVERLELSLEDLDVAMKF